MWRHEIWRRRGKYCLHFHGRRERCEEALTLWKWELELHLNIGQSIPDGTVSVSQKAKLFLVFNLAERREYLWQWRHSSTHSVPCPGRLTPRENSVRQAAGRSPEPSGSCAAAPGCNRTPCPFDILHLYRLSHLDSYLISDSRCLSLQDSALVRS
jgi:hypothetical protein